MRLALAQVNPTVGDLAGNRQIIEEAIGKAREAAADLVVFSEMALTGYPPMDLLDRKGFVRDQMRELDALVAASEGITVVLVHCEHGVSRGASSVLAYLIAHHVSRHDIAAVWVAFFSR